MKTYRIHFNKSTTKIRLKADHVVVSISENYGGVCLGEQYTFLDNESRIVGIFPIEEVAFIVEEGSLVKSNDEDIIKFDHYVKGVREN